jgi:hypothetical protein
MAVKPTLASAQAKPSHKLVEHDIRLTTELSEDGTRRVLALVQCERTGCEMSAATCAGCPRFVRIEAHEAGYTLLCHAYDVRRVDEPFCPEGSRSSDEPDKK